MNAIALRLQQFILAAAHRADLVLAVIVVLVIFMMILPLPTLMVDYLIGVSIGSAAILLMVAMYLPSPLSFASFPTVLLITTLFRLAISISTTRLILLQADAGAIIETFGNFVVGGNLIVGLVVFLIITIVQFIVITKGSERVAEVAARFSLDAMPGKQMSIDGDMRAGVIDMQEARRRRSLVEKESQLYGAMDGAMKFVKGDAIATLIIVAVNLVGGILIGVLKHGMDVAKAVNTYSILTIGDGLVAQIPALFISITAGIIVTRVSDDSGGPSNVGKDIGAQILAQPRALLVGAAIMLGFAVVPGMPAPVFLTLAVVVGGMGLTLKRASSVAAESKVAGKATKGEGLSGIRRGPADEEEFSTTVPLLLDVSADLENDLVPEKLNDELVAVRRALYHDLGVPYPGIQLRFNPSLPAQTYAILLSEIPVSQGQLRPDRVLVRENADHLQALNIPFEPNANFLPGIRGCWTPAQHAANLEKAGIGCLDNERILVHHLSHILRKYAADFLGIQETRLLLSNMEKRFPDLVKEVQRVLPIQKMAEILQRTVGEEVSIRNLRAVLEALIDWGQKEKDAVLLTEYVRTTLKRYISYKYAGSHNMLAAYLLAPNAEDTIRAAIRQTSSGSYLALDPNVTRALLDSVRRTVGDLSQARQRPVLLTSMDIRRYTRKLIEQDYYELPVLSYQELTNEINIQPIARIELQ